MKKEHIPVIIGLSLPFVFVIALALFIYLPNTKIDPQHDFLYTVSNNSNDRYQEKFVITNERIEAEQNTNLNGRTNIEAGTPDLFYYDVEDNTSRKIDLSQAEAYRLDPGPSSPDGYTVEYRRSHNGIFEVFGSSNNKNGFYITKDNGAKKLNGVTSSNNYYYYYNNFQLVGWVK